MNAVCPGFVDTPMTDQSVARVSAKTGRSDEQARAAVAQMNASGRLVHPDGVATMILTLCLPQSRDINGAAITVEYGSTARSLARMKGRDADAVLSAVGGRRG